MDTDELRELRDWKERTDTCRGKLSLWILEMEALHASEARLMHQLRAAIIDLD